MFNLINGVWKFTYSLILLVGIALILGALVAALIWAFMQGFNLVFEVLP